MRTDDAEDYAGKVAAIVRQHVAEFAGEVKNIVQEKVATLAGHVAARARVPEGAELNVTIDVAAIQEELDGLEQRLTASVAGAIGRLLGEGPGSGEDIL